MQVTTEQAELLILAAGGREAELLAAIEDVGAKAVSSLAVEELVFRCRLPSNKTHVHIQLDLLHGGERFTHTVGVRAGEPVTLHEGELDTAVYLLEFELAELVRGLYGPLRERRAGTHRSRLLVERPTAKALYDGPLRGDWYSVGRAVDTVLSGCSAGPSDLGELSVRHGTDKWGTWHWYTPHYERHLRALRGEPVRLLEIGIGGYDDPDLGGWSLKMWKAYFPRGLMTGLDVHAKHGLDEPRLRTVKGDQNDPDFLRAFGEEHGPFDVIVDDGSHVNEHIRTSFEALFSYVRPGGFYIIEDIWTAYCAKFGGDEGPVSPPTTSIGMLQALLDKLHYQERAGDEGDDIARSVVGVHVYHNIAFIEKGHNAEGGIAPAVGRLFESSPSTPR
ncbi:class I SAM-dependent methyltransferase [Actinomadura litoris]|uniref:Class I SAM-dependent methyltransferase n=1 Tax=Actinomadura litoris TaxID=2678616 RepID=A0A7K1KVL8_9ACTN|nr:class I SAM-dependent methyltransferase [Actinomadura litoris]MUN36169.1 class I SAM-dependent methyltransferase [Actinomadura litoris]